MDLNVLIRVEKMTKSILCPLCGSENSISETHCYKCGYEINSQKNNTKKSSDWLDELRTTSDQDRNLDANAQFIDDNFSDNDMQSDSLDWLNRIRNRKETDEEFNKFTEQISQQEEIRNEPDQTENLIENFRNHAEKNKKADTESSELISRFRNDDNSFEIISDDNGINLK